MNCFLFFPEGKIPLRLKYELISGKFSKPIDFYEKGKFCFDFCKKWCPDCLLADYCIEREELWTDEDDFNLCKTNT